MAKQTYTTGQVLTAAQMTALQANDYNWTVSAKTASYVLVAADAGTRITMSNAGATTITVNTALFTAGDTLTVTNIGAGACTITAGTATVSTAGSLVLNQYDSGTLYFSSTSAAIWNGANPGDITGVTAGTGISGGGTSGTVTVTNSMATEITAAGDIIVGTGSGTFDNLPIGTTAQVLTADTTVSPYKVKWATPAGGSTLSVAQIATGTMSGSTYQISGLSSYDYLIIELDTPIQSAYATDMTFSINGATSNMKGSGVGSVGNRAITTTPVAMGSTIYASSPYTYAYLEIQNCKSTGYKTFRWWISFYGASSTVQSQTVLGLYKATAAVSTVEFSTGSAKTFTGGSATIWGA